jgi:hypothetical protein
MQTYRIVMAWLGPAAMAMLWPGAKVDAGSNPPPRLEREVQTLLKLEQDDGIDGLANRFDDQIRLFAYPVPGFSNGRKNAVITLEKAIGTKDGVTRRQTLRAGIAADGRHAFTFGYMTTEVPREQPRLAKYVAFWVRDRAAWHIVLFKRVPRSDGDVSGPLLPAMIPRKALSRRIVPAVRASLVAELVAREAEFSDTANARGLGAAFRAFGHPEAANTGGGPRFTLGPEAIAAELGDDIPPFTWAADGGAVVADSGDLGVTWGMLRRKGPVPVGRLAEIPFFTVWYRSSPAEPWRYIAE